MSLFLTTEHPKSVVWLLQMCIKLQKTKIINWRSHLKFNKLKQFLFNFFWKLLNDFNFYNLQIPQVKHNSQRLFITFLKEYVFGVHIFSRTTWMISRAPVNRRSSCGTMPELSHEPQDSLLLRILLKGEQISRGGHHNFFDWKQFISCAIKKINSSYLTLLNL